MSALPVNKNPDIYQGKCPFPASVRGGSDETDTPLTGEWSLWRRAEANHFILFHGHVIASDGPMTQAEPMRDSEIFMGISGK